jgi:hypothetical protein
MPFIAIEVGYRAVSGSVALQPASVQAFGRGCSSAHNAKSFDWLSMEKALLPSPVYSTVPSMVAAATANLVAGMSESEGTWRGDGAVRLV